MQHTFYTINSTPFSYTQEIPYWNCDDLFLDTKASTSCYSLTNTAATVTTDDPHQLPVLFTSFNSINYMHDDSFLDNVQAQMTPFHDDALDLFQAPLPLINTPPSNLPPECLVQKTPVDDHPEEHICSPSTLIKNNDHTLLQCTSYGESDEEYGTKRKTRSTQKTIKRKRRNSSLPTLSKHQINSTRCSNCNTGNTPLWRRNPQGLPLCNACGLFYKLHGTVRPLSLKTDVIKKRNRNGPKDEKSKSKRATRTRQCNIKYQDDSSSCSELDSFEEYSPKMTKDNHYEMQLDNMNYF